jgi:hypothetical protein
MNQNNSDKNVNKYSFSPVPINFDIVLVTGVCRSGKTSLARLLGSMENVEYIDECWPLMNLPVMQSKGLISKDLAKQMIISYTKELMNDIILLRRANFRPNDLSNIWDLKSPSEIFERLTNLKTREDVNKHIVGKKVVLVFVLAELTPMISFFRKVFPECKIINSVRNGINVVEDIINKGWYSNKSLEYPAENIMYKKIYSKIYSKEYYLPWWVEDFQTEAYLQKNDLEKAMYYWRRILEDSEDQIKKVKELAPNKYKEIKFETLIDNPRKIVEELSQFIGVKTTDNTVLMESKLSALKEKLEASNSKNELIRFNDFPKEEMQKMNFLLEKYGYNKIKNN